MVVIDVGWWRSGRTGSAPRAETAGYARGAEEGKRCWGGKPSPLGRQEGVGGDAENAMMVKPSPPAAFVVIESEFILEFLKVALDPPADLRQPHELVDGDRLGHGREPVLGRLRLAARPFH